MNSIKMLDGYDIEGNLLERIEHYLLQSKKRIVVYGSSSGCSEGTRQRARPNFIQITDQTVSNVQLISWVILQCFTKL